MSKDHALCGSPGWLAGHPSAGMAGVQRSWCLGGPSGPLHRHCGPPHRQGRPGVPNLGICSLAPKLCQHFAELVFKQLVPPDQARPLANGDDSGEKATSDTALVKPLRVHADLRLPAAVEAASATPAQPASPLPGARRAGSARDLRHDQLQFATPGDGDRPAPPPPQSRAMTPPAPPLPGARRAGEEAPKFHILYRFAGRSRRSSLANCLKKEARARKCSIPGGPLDLKNKS